ncbi:MAG: uracil-DNA glycosylase [Chlamydiales bacterium]
MLIYRLGSPAIKLILAPFRENAYDLCFYFGWFVKLMIDTFPVCLSPSWQEVLEKELEKPYFVELADFVESERRKHPNEIYPARSLVFNAFIQTPFDKVKVVILGQDPYHGPGQAHGLSFSVPKGVMPPPSLKNIYKELEADLGSAPPDHGCLLSWAQQGVLLLNTVLTVRRGEPHSHKGKGWETFTDAVIRQLSYRKNPVVFLLWGKAAQEKCSHAFTDEANVNHLILKAAHPSPYSANNGFFGCRHFSKANSALEKWGRTPIDWGAL